MFTRKTKFEDWPIEEKKKFVGAFIAANLERGHTLVWRDDTLFGQQDYDFILNDEAGSVVKCQHTLTGSGDAGDYAYDANCSEVIQKLKSLLGDLNGVHLSLTFKRSLRKSETDKVAYQIEFIVRQKMTSRPTLFSYSKDDEDDYYQILRPHVESFSILSFPDSPGVTFGYGSGGSVLADDQRFLQRVTAKESSYSDPGDLVLIVHENFISGHPIYREKLRHNLASSKFREIWYYDDWNPSFDRIK